MILPFSCLQLISSNDLIYLRETSWDNTDENITKLFKD